MERKCSHYGCNHTEETTNLTCVEGYGFYCEEHYEESFVTCPHCEEVTMIPLKHQTHKTCGWCDKDISECIM